MKRTCEASSALYPAFDFDVAVRPGVRRRESFHLPNYHLGQQTSRQTFLLLLDPPRKTRMPVLTTRSSMTEALNK